jgi:hypothetical protein
MAKQTLSSVLKQAIEEHDWDVIINLYKAITGETIKQPKKPKHKNLFKDDGKLVKKESAAVKKLYNEPNLDNRRVPIIYIDVKCKGCGKVESLPSEIASRYNGDPEHGSPEYKCQTCIKSFKVG